MKKFFTTTFACVLGVMIAGILLTLLSIAALTGMAVSTETEYTAKPNTIMKLDLGIVTDRSQEDFMSVLFGNQQKTDGLDNIIKAIKTAKTNPNIAGIYIDANGSSLGVATLDRIHRALKDFKESDKFIYAYADDYTQREYLLSAVADSVVLNPVGAIDFRGLASQIMFVKGLYDKLGIEVQVLKVGTYKSAVEPYINTQMSEANREQTMAYMTPIWNHLLEQLSQDRDISVDQLNNLADTLLVTVDAKELIAKGLVDTLMYRPQMNEFLKAKVGIDKDDDLIFASINEVASIKQAQNKAKDEIAIVYAEGGIDMGETNGVNTAKLVEDLTKIQNDKNVKAVVLRVNSPGGSAFASEQIWHAVKELKAKKPVIVSMGDYAASGGYYISCAADSIIAEPTTLTGSIGIFGMIPNVKGLTEKIGLTYDVVKTNQFSDFGNLMRPVNSDERALLQMMIGQGYDLFVSRCAEGRHMSKDKIEKIAEGRVWTGEMAKKIGLVDELGGIGKALEIAAQKADLKGYTIISYPAKKDILSTLLDVQPGNYVESQVLKSQLGDYYKDFSLLKNIKERAMIQARVPFELNVK